TTTWTLPVHDAVLKPVGKTVTFTENMPASVVVASFEDADPNGSAGQYAASINWGDGTPPTIGTVTANGTGFDVTSTHTYTRAANSPNTPARYPVTVTITDVGGATATATGTAVVTPPPLQATPRNFAVNKGVPFNGAVATFTDPDPRTDPSKYTAT